MNSKVTITLISFYSSGMSDQISVDPGTTVQGLLEENSITPDECTLIRVNRKNVTLDYILEDGDKVTVTPRNLKGEQRVKVKNRIWYVHPNDPDHFPSKPHAHDKVTGEKLDLRNGHIYRRGKRVGKLTRKHLMRVRAGIKGIVLPKIEV